MDGPPAGKETAMSKYTWTLAILLAGLLEAPAQQPAVIESFDFTGQLTFSPMSNAASYRVEWAPSANGPWTNFTGEAGQCLDHMVTAGTEPITVSVPMLFRVVATWLPVFAVSNSGTSAYLIDGEANPVLNLVRGQSYAIEIDSPGNPFWIKSSPTTGTGDSYNDGLSTNGIESGTILFTVPLNAPDILYYICQFHSAMQGVIAISGEPLPEDMVLIPAGTNEGTNILAAGESYAADYFPAAYNLSVRSFFMDQYEVTKALWDEVYAWAITNGYTFDNAGSGKAANHPVHTVNWYDVVKWCNARSEREGRPTVYTINGVVYRTGRRDEVVQTSVAGYRLPTSEEWEYAARGGAVSRRFPWTDSDEIQHARANYESTTMFSFQNSYDTSPTRGFHPAYNDGIIPYTSPAGAFAANDYGLYDMASNVREWCFGRFPDEEGTNRVFRSGAWSGYAYQCRIGMCSGRNPGETHHSQGFRTVLCPGQQ